VKLFPGFIKITVQYLGLVPGMKPAGVYLKRGLLQPGKRTQVAAAVDAVHREDSRIVEVLFPDADPAQLVTDFFDF